jgi:hypothetical protein
MSENHFETLCRQGEQADRLSREGKHAEAEALYLSLFKDIRDGKEIDSFLVAKVTLGLILARLRAGKVQAAFDVWTQDPGDSLLGLGVQFIETGQVSPRDAVVYDFICARFHSLSGEDVADAGMAVSHYLARICDWAEKNDRSMLPSAVAHWRQALQEVFGQAIPPEHLKAIEQVQKKHSLRVPHGAVTFPEPSPWKIDWTSAEASLTVFGPDGVVETISEQDWETRKQKKKKRA